MDAINNKCVLFFPSHKTSFSKLLQIANAVTLDHSIVFLIANRHAAENVQLIQENGFEIVYVKEGLDAKKNVDLDGPISNKLVKENIFLKSKNFFLKSIKKLPVLKKYFDRRYIRYASHIQESTLIEYKALKSDVEKFFLTISPKLIIASGDRNLNYDCCILSVAKANGIKIIIPPISLIGASKELANDRYSERFDTHVPKDKNIIAKFPDQFCLTEQGDYVSFYPVLMIEPLNALGVLPAKPWVYGESFADLLLVDGDLQKQMSIEDKLPLEKIKVVGDTELDHLFKARKKYINESTRKASTSSVIKRVVIALPQLYEHKLISFDEQWQLVNDLCRGVIENQAEAVLSLHPKMSLSHYQSLQELEGVSISSKPLRDVLATADIFIASNGSSTWLWASLCGIPTVLCDWSGLNYNLIDTEKLGVKVIRSKNKFSEYMSKLIYDKNYYESQVLAQHQGSRGLAMFDGKASFRISATINKMGNSSSTTCI